MPGVWKLRAGKNGIRVPDDLSQEHAKRALRRDAERRCEVIDQPCIWVDVYERATPPDETI